MLRENSGSFASQFVFFLCLSENSLPKPKSLDAKVSHSVLAMKSGERESSGIPSSSSPSSSSTSLSLTSPKEHKGAPVIVPLIKPSAGSVPRDNTCGHLAHSSAAPRFTHAHITHDLCCVYMGKVRVQGQLGGWSIGFRSLLMAPKHSEKTRKQSFVFGLLSVQ